MGKRGPAPGSGGRPKKALADKLTEGNLGHRPLTVIDFGDSMEKLKQDDMPEPADFMSAPQSAEELTSTLDAVEIYKATWQWLMERDCTALVSPQLIERFAMASARWRQCENAVSKTGFLMPHPTTGAPMQSPYVSMADKYMTQANKTWSEIFQIVRENCTTEFKGSNSRKDTMESLLQARKSG